MKKIVHYSVYLLILGFVILAIGVWGSVSASADTIRQASEILFQGMQIAVYAGTGMIVLSGILFFIATAKSE